MKFSAADWCFVKPGTDPARYYDSLRRLGITVAEMVPVERRGRARAAGLQILNLAGPGMQQGLNRREHHAVLVPQILATIAEAGQEKIAQVIMFSGNRAGQADADGIDNCRRALEQVLPAAAAAGVTLTFEMFNTHDHPDYQADSSAYGIRLAETIRSPAFKLLYDIYHMERMGEDTAAIIPANLKRIAHLHVAAAPKRNCPRPNGQIQYEKIVPAAVRAGYDGYWGLEFSPTSDPLAEIQAARDFLRACAIT